MPLRDELLKRRLMSSSGLPPRAPPLTASSMHANKRSAKDYTPLTWDTYFESMEDVMVPESNATFRVYKSGFADSQSPHAPLLMLLHGGGYSGLSWSLFVKSLTELAHVRILAVDLRGHGSTHSDRDDDLSADTLAKDVALLFQHIAGNDGERVILMGHSLGGAIAVRSSLLSEYFGPSLAGLIVIDVVEGTALDALQSMQSFLRGRPKEFPCLEKAIEWSVRSGQTKNVESARISMPSQLVAKKSFTWTQTRAIPSFSDAIREEEEELHHQQEHECDHANGKSAVAADVVSEPPSASPSPAEAGETGEQSEHKSETTRFEFRVDLSQTESHWRGWFEGLSQHFLDSPSPAKLLLLAGIDTLDRPLTIGQMQGRFQMRVLPECGHAVHEDLPDQVAEIVAMFLIRNQLTSAREGSEHRFAPSFPGC